MVDRNFFPNPNPIPNPLSDFLMLPRTFPARVLCYMHRSLSRWTAALFIVVAAATLIWHELPLTANGKLTVRFLSVGEGAATLVTTPSGKRILITGGAGFIGSNLAKALAEKNTVFIVDDLS